MPGLCFVYDMEGDMEASKERILESFASLKHYSWYEGSILLDGEGLFLGYTGYENYPIRVIEKDGYHICLEGVIYGRSPADLQGELERLPSILFDGRDTPQTGIPQWLSRTDGEFLLSVLDKRSGEMCVLNDALGRLPVYYHEADGRVILSRETRFIANLIGEIRLDRDAIAQYLLFGYPLGSRTLFEEVHRLGPASLLRVGPPGRETSLEEVLRTNVEEYEEEGRSLEHHAEIIAESLSKSCHDRAQGSDTVLMALSGGLDSRTVAACLVKRGIPFTGITFLDSAGTAGPDIPIAEKVAGILGFEWRLFRLDPPRGGDVMKLLSLKSGMNYLGMSFCLPLCLELRKTYGAGATLFTGDGGDKLLPDIRPPVRLGDIHSTALYIIDHFGAMPLDLVSRLTGTERGAVIEGLEQRLDSYEEHDMIRKFMHFLLFERNFKWLFEGEDRNRCHLWATSPFYSPECFFNALRCPDRHKARYRLYREVLRRLSPALASVDYAKWGTPIDSKTIDFYCFLRKHYLALPSALRKLLSRVYKRNIDGYGPDSAVLSCIRTQLDGCGAISDYISAEDARRSLHGMSRTEIENLFTVTSVIEDLQGAGSTIERYRDSFLM